MDNKEVALELVKLLFNNGASIDPLDKFIEILDKLKDYDNKSAKKNQSSK